MKTEGSTGDELPAQRASRFRSAGDDENGEGPRAGTQSRSLAEAWSAAAQIKREDGRFHGGD